MGRRKNRLAAKLRAFCLGARRILNPLTPLLTGLAGLFAAENRVGGMQSARALLDAAARPVALAHQTTPPLGGALAQCLAGDPHPLTPLIRQAAPYLKWVFSQLDGRIRDEIALGMMQAELIGPGALFESDAVSIGLFVQSPDLDYVTRQHAAEESFFMLGGLGLWTAGDGPEHAETAGAQIHHPSMMPHASRTAKMPLLAAWRWTGDISVEQYTLKG